MTSIDEEDKTCKNEDDLKVVEMCSLYHEQKHEDQKVKIDEAGTLCSSLKEETSQNEQGQKISNTVRKSLLESGEGLQCCSEENSGEVKDNAGERNEQENSGNNINIDKESRMNNEIEVEQNGESKQEKECKEQVQKIEWEVCIVNVQQVIAIWDKDIVDKIEGKTVITIETELIIDQDTQQEYQQKQQEQIIQKGEQIEQVQPDTINYQSFPAISQQQQISNLPTFQPQQTSTHSYPQSSSDYRPKKSLIQMLYFEQQPTISQSNQPDFNPCVFVSQPLNNIAESSSPEPPEKDSQQSLYPELTYPIDQTQVVPNPSAPLSASFDKLSSPSRNRQRENPIIASSLPFNPEHFSTPLTLISFPADKPISIISQYAPEFQQQFIQQYQRYMASKETVNPSPPLSPFSPRTESIYQQNFINNLPYYHNIQYQEIISPPLSHFPEAEFVDSIPSQVQAPPDSIQINIYHSSQPISPPVIEKEPYRTLKTDQSSIRKSFQRIHFPTTQCRIVGNHRYVESPTDKTDQFSAQQLLTTLKQLKIPKKSQRVQRAQNLEIEQVHSQRKILNNIKLFNAPQNKIDSIIIKPLKSKKQDSFDTKPVPFQQQLKFNIEREFPVSTESHTKYLSQNQYNYNQSITSNYPVNNNYSYQESSDYNIPSANWLCKESLKITPRMNFSYIYPKVSLETPHYNNSYENGNSGFLREEKEVAPPSGGRNIKISLCSPKAPKIRSNDGKVKRNFIKLRSPHRKDDVFHSREKCMSPAIEPNSDFRSNQANSYQLNSGASPKKKKLKLVQKTKSPFTQVPASAIPQKQISLFEQDNTKVVRVSNQLHREKIKITLKTNPPKPMEIEAQQPALADQSEILVEYQQNQRPIHARIH